MNMHEWDIFGSFSKRSPKGILQGFFSLLILRIQKLSLILLQFVQG